MRINILTIQHPYKRGFNDFYPILKWRKEFKLEGINFSFCSSFESVNLDSDIVIIDHRYLSSIGDRTEKDRTEIIEKIESIKKACKVILFDRGDGTGSRCFWLTSYVDLHLKKQLLKERSRYTGRDMTACYMKWIPEQIIKDVFREDNSYVGCPQDQLHKLHVAWNIGNVDYRTFPFSRYYPTSFIPNFISSGPKILKPSNHRKIAVSYRGDLHPEPHYNYQRSRVIAILKKLKANNSSIIVGGKISKSEYIKESQNSKVMISPYGWGEICFRDFEAFIYGCLLIKPDMSHLETFPNLFLPNETYLPIDWNIIDLEESLDHVLSKYTEYINIAQYAQDRFVSYINSFEIFHNKIKEIIFAINK
ncbi:hypothetical protein [Pleomorphovibrio marinus]|uniref:hypothetical protein n=1 Tax=Pleomorphovibrio marinus TaxID=2164132 RepID=UPI000E0C9C2E|nr:hypothetical protein [Pleomorphovibrio marinus]